MGSQGRGGFTQNQRGPPPGLHQNNRRNNMTSRTGTNAAAGKKSSAPPMFHQKFIQKPWNRWKAADMKNNMEEAAWIVNKVIMSREGLGVPGRNINVRECRSGTDIDKKLYLSGAKKGGRGRGGGRG